MASFIEKKAAELHGGCHTEGYKDLIVKLNSIVDTSSSPEFGSTGQQMQMILCGMLYKIALGQSYDYICLDEALSGIDEGKSKTLYKMIQQALVGSKTTLVIIHHGYKIDNLSDDTVLINGKMADNKATFITAAAWLFD